MSNDEVARAIVDGVAYMVLATADAEGHPWASPVWFAADGYDVFYWMSAPDAQHSRNIAAQPDVGIVVFDSTTDPETRQAVYIRGTAQRVDDREAVAHGLEVCSRTSVDQGLGELAVEDISGEARLRLYCVRAHEHWVLEPERDVRVRVHP